MIPFTFRPATFQMPFHLPSLIPLHLICHSLGCSLQVIAMMSFPPPVCSFLNLGQSPCQLCAHFSWLRSLLKCHSLPETLEPPRLISLVQALPAPSTLETFIRVCRQNCAIIGVCLSAMRVPEGRPFAMLLTWVGPSCVGHRCS